MPIRHRYSLLLAVSLAACGGGNSESPSPTPGSPASGKTEALDAGAALIQSKPPVGALNAYLDGFHFASGDLTAQVEAHHYCAMLSEDLTQCVIFDGNTRDAKLMGVEYIVSAALFRTLPAKERTLWHSHAYEVKSGQLVAPGLPHLAEHELMEKIVSTYGKTWHTWDTHGKKDLPEGIPQLMMGFTRDGQANAAMMAGRDERMGVDIRSKQKARDDIVAPEIEKGADAWQGGRSVQLRAVSGKNRSVSDSRSR